MSTSPFVVGEKHPNQDFERISTVGLTALGLAVEFKTQVEPRLPANTTLGLQEDLEDLGVAIPATIQVRSEAKVSVEQQGTTLENAWDRVSAVRKAVRNAHPPTAVKHAYGVGKHEKKDLVNPVKAAIKQILDRLGEHPEEASSFGILQDDIDALTADLEAIKAAVTAKKKKRSASPGNTRERNRLANRVLRAAQRIAGAGVLAFASKPVERARFEAIHVTPPGRSRGKNKAKDPKVAAKVDAAKAAPKQATTPEKAADAAPTSGIVAASEPLE